MLATALLTCGFFAALSLSGAASAAPTAVTVKPSSMNGWYFWNDKDDTFAGSPGALVSGPAIPPIGSGSVELGPLTDAGTTAAGHSVIATNAYTGTRVADISGLSYSSYQTGPTQAIALQFDVRYRPTDVNYGGRLVFEPYQNGTVIVGPGWQPWSPLAGKWWASNTGANGSGGAQATPLPAGNCGMSSPCTMAQILGAFPNATIGQRFVLKAGSGPGWVGFDGNADKLQVTIGGATPSDNLFNFEPETPCTTVCYVNGTTGNDAFGGDTPATAKQHIQAAVNQVNPNGTVNVAAGTYNEDVGINKALSLLGAGSGSTTIVGPIGGPASTLAISASNVIVDGFTITRAGNNTTDWNNPNLNSAGISISSLATTNVKIRNSTLTGNRTGIDVNNSGGHSIHDNVIDNNRTGLIFRNQTDNLDVSHNLITNNWTLGIVFLDGSGGTNSPVQTALNSTYDRNNITDNWYGGVVDRQTGGALPAPGANPKNFECNYWGGTPTTSTANSTEPGYAAQIPVLYGGTATPPATAQPDILGPASANVDYSPWLVTSDLDGDCNGGSARGYKYAALGDLAGIVPSGNADTDKKINEAIKQINKSLDRPNWTDDSHITTNKIFDDEKNAVKQLMGIKNPPAGVTQAIMDLVAGDELLAQTAIADAIAANGKPSAIADAQDEIEKAEAEAAKGHWDAAIDHYKHAWEKIQKA
jgi:nitrous oxidase accessory protein NosD